MQDFEQLQDSDEDAAAVSPDSDAAAGGRRSKRAKADADDEFKVRPCGGTCLRGELWL
jgi:hypothetical protein